MKKLLLSFALVASTLGIQAQKRNQLFIQVGRTIPVGAFGSTKRDDAAFATSERGVLFGYMHHFGRFYIGTQISLLSNHFNTGAYDRLIKNSTPAGTTSITTHNGYAYVGAHLVLGVDYPIDSTLFIGLHIKPGRALYLAGDLNNTTISGNKTVVSSLAGFAETDFSYTLGTQVRKVVAKNISLLGTIDYYFGTVSSYTNFKQTLNGNTIENRSGFTELKYRNLFITLGLSYDF